MTRPAILLLGAGGHARSCIDVIELTGHYEVAGLTGLSGEVGTTMLGYPVIGTDLDLAELLASHDAALVSVGQIKSPDLRMRLFGAVEACRRVAAPIVSPRAYVSRHAEIGEGSIVMHGAVVNAGAVVGLNCIINSQALVEHDARIGDHCHISTNAALNSGVRVGPGTFIGSGASVKQLTTIGERCVIGMGQRVLSDCADGTWLPSPKVPT